MPSKGKQPKVVRVKSRAVGGPHRPEKPGQNVVSIKRQPRNEQLLVKLKNNKKNNKNKNQKKAPSKIFLSYKILKLTKTSSETRQ